MILLNFDPSVLGGALGDFFEQNHAVQPVLKGWIIDRSRRIRNFGVKAFKDLLMRVVIAFAVPAG